jgi:hypothetical protein
MKGEGESGPWEVDSDEWVGMADMGCSFFLCGGPGLPVAAGGKNAGLYKGALRPFFARAMTARGCGSGGREGG